MFSPTHTRSGTRTHTFRQTLYLCTHGHEAVSGLVMTFSLAFHFPSVVTVVKALLVVKLVNEFICCAQKSRAVC